MEQLRSCQPAYYFNPLPPHGGRLISKLLPPEVAHFNPLPPHGGRRLRSPLIILTAISIHSLHTEGDLFFRRVGLQAFHFNPLPPHGGRQKLSLPGNAKPAISIHSLHTEGDSCLLLYFLGGFGISIHSLHTEGDGSRDNDVCCSIISIHSLHTEGDSLKIQSDYS